MSSHWYFGNGRDDQTVSVQCTNNKTIITTSDNMRIIATGAVTLGSTGRAFSWRPQGGLNSRPGPRGPLHANGTVRFQPSRVSRRHHRPHQQRKRKEKQRMAEERAKDRRRDRRGRSRIWQRGEHEYELEDLDTGMEDVIALGEPMDFSSPKADLEADLEDSQSEDQDQTTDEWDIVFKGNGDVGTVENLNKRVIAPSRKFWTRDAALCTEQDILDSGCGDMF